MKRGWIAVTTVAVVLLGFATWAWWDFADFQQRNLEVARHTGVEGVQLADLLAQHKMAEFSYGVMLFGAFSIVISLGGLVGLLVTLRVNRQMIEATREISQNESRAYPLPLSVNVFSGDEEFEISLLIENYGSTPALHVRADCGFFDRRFSGARAFKVDTREIPIVAKDAVLHMRFPWIRLEEHCRTFRNGKAMFGEDFEIAGTIHYHDVFGDEYVTTLRAYGSLPPKSTGTHRLDFDTGFFAAFKKVPKLGSRT